MADIYDLYRVKPDRQKAVKVTETNKQDIAQWCGGEVMEKGSIEEREAKGVLYIPSLQGPLSADVGDYVAQDESGRFNVFSADRFEARYEKYSQHPRFRG